jgi:hypothetical protein
LSELRRRVLSVQVGTIKIDSARDGLRVVAKGSRTLKPEPNKCDVSIYNLSPAHRAALTKEGNPTLVLSAGYENATTQIFYGQALSVSHLWKDGDVITTIGTTDGGKAVQHGRVKATFPKGTKAGDVLKVLVKALGIKAGNLDQAVAKINAGKGASIYAEGVCVSGNAKQSLTALCRSAGLEWSVQDGKLQILDLNRSLAVRAIVLDKGLLLGSPSVTLQKAGTQTYRIVEGQTFIQGDFVPGRQVQIAHPFVSGAFRLEKCEYTLDTHAEDWYVAFEAKGLA